MLGAATGDGRGFMATSVSAPAPEPSLFAIGRGVGDVISGDDSPAGPVYVSLYLLSLYPLNLSFLV